MRYIAAEDVAKAKEMEKYITDERTGLKYELVGDYYLIAGDDEPEQEPIGIWQDFGLDVGAETVIVFYRPDLNFFLNADV